jgi:hypothetical protein
MINNILINSKNKTRGDNNNFYISFDEPIMNVHEIKLLHVNIPVTWYNINQYNNVINFNEGGPDLQASLPQGNYTVADLQTQIKTSMEAVGALTYTVTYSNVTMKLTITGSGVYSLNFNNNSSEIWQMLGYDNINYPSLLSQVAPNVIDLTPIKQILIMIPELGLIGRSSNTNNEYTFIVPVNVNRSEVINYNDNINFNQHKLGYERDIINLHVMLKDQNNRLIEFNGSNINLLIQIN